MASLNQFKLLEQKCKKYFKLLEQELNREISIKKKSDEPRFGFYFYILECVTNIREIDQIINLVTDTDFNDTIYGCKYNDYGIDAVYINGEKQEIDLFNFKYREKYNKDGQQSANEVFKSTKFTSALVNYDSSKLQGKLKDYADKIIANLQSNDIWKMNLYVVSNEVGKLTTEEHSIEHLKRMYDLEVKSITLEDIADFMSIRPESISAKMVLDSNSVLSYSEGSLASAMSYVIRLTVPELIRITSDNPAIRNEYNIEDYSKVSEVKLDFTVLFDNVRGFLGKTKYNENILNTLKNEPSKFFMYNNGITIIAENINAEPINVKKKIKLDISKMQVVNGGQTLRTIHDFNQSDKENIQKCLSEAEILIRIFQTNPKSKLTNRIAEYTNSQNAISVIDLKSLAYEQLEIEKYLDEHNIIYARKIGDTGSSENRNYEHKISLEKFGQILFSINGNPEKASNQKKRIFDKHYNEIFGEDSFKIESSVDIVKEYFNIKNTYNDLPEYQETDQKIFYILYLNRNRKKDIKDNIVFLEKCLHEFRQDEEVPNARKLIQRGFKDFIVERI